MSRNDNYTTRNLLEFLILSHLFNFTGKLEEEDVEKINFIAEKQHKTIISISLNILSVTE